MVSACVCLPCVIHISKEIEYKITISSAVEILLSFVRHSSDRILDFVGPNKILLDQTFYKAYGKTMFHVIFNHLKIKKYSILSLKCYEMT